MNFQKYFLQSESITDQTDWKENQSFNNNSENANNNNNNNNNLNNKTLPKKQYISKAQQYEIDRKRFFKENRKRAKPSLSQQGIYNRRFESNFEWGHDTITNFRGVKGSDWTRNYGFTYANDFNTLERDIDSDYVRSNIKNCRYCFNTYPDTESYKVLENDPPTVVGGCVKCHPELCMNDHHHWKDDYYPVLSNQMNTIKPTDNLTLYHNTRNCTITTTNTNMNSESVDKNQSTASTVENKNQSNCEASSNNKKQKEKNEEEKKEEKSDTDTILIDQNNSNVFIGDYQCKDNLKSHLNQTGFHSDQILPAGLKSVSHLNCRLKNIIYDNTSTIYFNEESTAPNIEREKPSYKALIRYNNQSFIPFNHVEYNPNLDKEHEFDNKTYNYPNEMRINQEFDYNDTKNDYKIPYNNTSSYDEFIKNNKNAPQNMYYKDIKEQYKHLYDNNKNLSKSRKNNDTIDEHENNNNNNNNNADDIDDKSINSDVEKLKNNNSIMSIFNYDYSKPKHPEKRMFFQHYFQDSITKILNENENINNNKEHIEIYSTNIKDNNDNNNNNNNNQELLKSSSNRRHTNINYRFQSPEYGYFFCSNDLSKSKEMNDEIYNNEEDYRKAILKLSEEQGFLNGYLPYKYQSHVESYENPLYYNHNVLKSTYDIETERRLKKIENQALEESIDNSLAYQFDSIYKIKENEDRKHLYNKMNNIHYDMDNWEDFVSLSTFNSKLKENLIPSKRTEKQNVNVENDNLFYGVIPNQQKRHGDQPPFDKTKIHKETPLQFLYDFGVEFGKGVMRCRKPPFKDCDCWINETSKSKVEQPLPFLYASRNIKFNELKTNDYISPNLKRLLEQDYRNTGKIGSTGNTTNNISENKVNTTDTTTTNNNDDDSSNKRILSSNNNLNNTQTTSRSSLNLSEKKVSSENKIQFHNNSYINKDNLDDLIINQKDDSQDKNTSLTDKLLASIKAPKRITCCDRSHNYIIYDYESIKAKKRNNNRIKNLASKQKIFKSSLNVLS